MHRPHVLVVDDEPCDREALTAALHPTYVGHAAATGTEALACLRTQPIAAIILDAVLNDERGLDLVDRFRAIRPVRILLLTGHSSEDLAIHAVWAGVEGYLKKPLSVPVLRAALDGLLPQESRPLSIPAQARRYLDGHLEKPFDPATMAGDLGVSEAHLRQLFRNAYGKTPRRYLTELRMRRAETLLLMNRNINEIAGDVGYPNTRAFRRAFRAAYGLTPSESRPDHRDRYTPDRMATNPAQPDLQI